MDTPALFYQFPHRSTNSSNTPLMSGRKKALFRPFSSGFSVLCFTKFSLQGAPSLNKRALGWYSIAGLPDSDRVRKLQICNEPTIGLRDLCFASKLSDPLPLSLSLLVLDVLPTALSRFHVILPCFLQKLISQFQILSVKVKLIAYPSPHRKTSTYIHIELTVLTSENWSPLV